MKAKHPRKSPGPRVATCIEVFVEDGQFVGLCRDLNVSSFGDSEDEARRSTREALQLFLEECRNMGTLEDVLREAGYIHGPSGCWVQREPLLIERVTVEAA